jgi:pilus assembly protein Flp/PilA
MVDPIPLRRARRFLAALWHDRRAATAVEYGLILALIVLALMAALVSLGGQSQMTWGNIHDKVKAASPN